MYYSIAVIVLADNLSVGINALGDGISAAGGINRLIRICRHLLAPIGLEILREGRQSCPLNFFQMTDAKGLVLLFCARELL
jgi:hypothetical protein